MKLTTSKIISVILIFSLSSCGQSEKEIVTIHESEEILKPEIEAGLRKNYSGDPSKGKRLFLQCRACHSLRKGEPHKIGPNLYNFFGKKAGSQEKFKYSSELTASVIIWDYENLDLWLENPQAMIPANKMVYVGMRNPQDRKDLIAYLLEETH